jgi:hydroxyacylglutathione hydrolase
VLVKAFQTGGDRNLAYVVADESTNEAAVIDPSYSPSTIVNFTNEQGLRVAYAFCTHDHHDHTNGNGEFEQLTGVRPLLFGDRDPKTETVVEGGVALPLGALAIRILHTPGHTADSISLLIEDALFTGDTLFVGKVGGTDLGNGARSEYDSLHEILLKLPDGTRVFPGHDVGVTSQSTIGRERETNPFLLCADVASFLDLKRNWAEYKKEHGIA